MKLEIYGSPKLKEKIVRLRLEPSSPGSKSITIRAVDEHGETVPCGDLITFHDDGTIYRHLAVNSDLGFSLEEEGHIRLRTLS